MGRSFPRIDFARWLFQQEKEDRSGEAVVQQGHRKAQSSQWTIDFSAGNTDAVNTTVTTDGVMSQVMQERRRDDTIGKVDSVTVQAAYRKSTIKLGRALAFAMIALY